MPATSLPRIPLDADPQQQIIAINQALDELDWLIGGALDSKNAREFGGWLVGNTELQSKDKTVGMSTESAPVPADDIRFWAGDVKTGTPKFKVTKGGILTTISAIFKSALGYPRVEVNSTDNLIAAYSDANNYIAIIPNYSAVPSVVMVDTGVTKAFMRRVAGSGLQIGTIGGEPVNIQSGAGAFQINGTSGWTGTYQVVTSVTFGPTGGGSYTFKTVTVNNGITTNVSP